MATKAKESVANATSFWSSFNFVQRDRRHYTDPVLKRRKYFITNVNKQIALLEGKEVKARRNYKEGNGGIQIWFTFANTTIKLDDKEACFVFPDKESAIGAFKSAIAAVEAGQLDMELERASSKPKTK